jgi:PAS domain S-box-containing protein
LASLLEGTAEAAFAVDLQGQIRTWNRGATRLFGCDSELAIGRPCATVVNGHGETGSAVCQLGCHRLEQLRRTTSYLRAEPPGAESGDFDIEARPAGRAPFWCNVSLLLAADPCTDRRFVIHFVRDIDERKRTERFARDVLGLARRFGSDVQSTSLRVPPLTTQEQRILELLRNGVGTEEIARRLGISARTLRNHIHHFHQKLGTHSRLEAVVRTGKQGFA